MFFFLPFAPKKINFHYLISSLINNNKNRLVHYTGIVLKKLNQKLDEWARKVINGKHNRNNYLPHRSHRLYPGPSSL